MKSLTVFIAASILFASSLPLSLNAKSKKLEKGNTIENLLHPPRVYNMTMSPDGKYAASVAPIGTKGDRGIVIFDLDEMKVHRSFKISGKEINSVTWTTAEDVAFTLSKWGAYVDGVYSVNVNRKEIHPLIKNDAVVQYIDSVRLEPYSWIWIRDGYKVKPGLAQIRDTGSARTINIAETEIASTNANPLISNRIPNPPGQVYGWYIDQNHQPRIVIRFHDDKLEYLHRYSDDEDWTTLPLAPEEWDIELFGTDENELFIAGYNGQDTKGLHTYDIETGEIGELIFRDEYYDFSDSAVYLRHNNAVVGFRYMKDAHTFVWLLDDLKGIQEVIDATLPGRVNVIYNSSEDFSRHLIYSYSDKSPPNYALLDLKNKSLKEITQSAPWLDHDNLARTEVFHFKTSDGLKLEGYLTRPLGKEGPYPTICLVHGGPWARDTAHYDDETQFFASQGYAVIRVNYRGSTGYGKKISFEPEFDFKAMQGDITEAVQTAIKYGISDPNRIAIMGASFGGYSALCGATFEPDLYRCAITNMGVFDWEEMTKSRKRQDHRYSHHRLVEEFGDPKKNEEKFIEISPIHHVENIKIPILIIHGKDDSNVSIRQSKLLKSELKKHGVEHETHFVGDEGHNIFDHKKRVKTYQLVLDFLEKHMK